MTISENRQSDLRIAAFGMRRPVAGEAPCFPRHNNLEWLRLFFALQVVVGHCSAHLGSPFPKILAFFPGVPAFFFVSGFLIYASHANSGGWRYFQNRFLRLFPALLFVTLGGLAVVLVAKGPDFLAANALHVMIWFGAQITLGQAYNPAMFRDIGVGVINGSLWTITTEILFYIAVPIICILERYFKHTVLVLVAGSFLFYAIGEDALSEIDLGGEPLWRYFWITPIVWGWMFGFGILAFKYYGAISRAMRFLPIVIVPMVLLMMFGDKGPVLNTQGQELGIVYFVLYVILIFFIAFGTPYLALNFDLSYGVYIWHMPIINLLLVLSFPSVWMTFAGTIFLAAISWFYIEKPTLRLKRKSIHQV